MQSNSKHVKNQCKVYTLQRFSNHSFVHSRVKVAKDFHMVSMYNKIKRALINNIINNNNCCKIAMLIGDLN